MVPTNPKIAFLFPGQGAVPESPVLDFLGTSVETTYKTDATPDTPKLPHFQQSTITSDQSAQLGVFNLTLAMAHKALDYCTPDIITGYSSGLYAAMVASNSLSRIQGHNAIELAYRGVKRLKKKYVMVGVIGLKVSEVVEILGKLPHPGQLSLVNNKSQVIVSIMKELLSFFTSQCNEAGALNIIPLPFTHPYHIAELQPASADLHAYFKSLQLPPLHVPLVAGSSPEFIPKNATRVASLVADQLHQTVWWYKTIHCLIENGATTFVVFDPTYTLTRIILWINRQIKTIGIGTMADFNQLQDL